jgi:hypothetical protein
MVSSTTFSSAGGADSHGKPYATDKQKATPSATSVSQGKTPGNSKCQPQLLMAKQPASAHVVSHGCKPSSAKMMAVSTCQQTLRPTSPGPPDRCEANSCTNHLQQIRSEEAFKMCLGAAKNIKNRSWCCWHDASE